MNEPSSDPLATTRSQTDTGRNQSIRSRWAAGGAILFLGLLLSESSISTASRIAWLAATTLSIGWWISPHTSAMARAVSAVSWCAAIAGMKTVWLRGFIPEGEWTTVCAAGWCGIAGTLAGAAVDSVSVASAGAVRRWIGALIWFAASAAAYVTTVIGVHLLATLSAAVQDERGVALLVVYVISAGAGGLVLGACVEAMYSRLYDGRAHS